MAILTKQRVIKMIPEEQRPLARLIYRGIKDPSNYLRHKNQYQCNKEMCKSERINFVPPIFAMTIAENCNLRCPSCLYLLDDPNKFYTKFLSVEKFREILEKYNSDKKADIIFMSGGEVTMHPDLKVLIDICLEYRAKPRVSSNGILITKRINDLLKLNYINVSVDSYDYDSFKAFRGGTPKQFDLIREGLKLLKAHNMNFSMSFVLSKDNVRDAMKLIQYAETIQPPLVHFHNINPHGHKEYVPLSVDDQDTQEFIKTVTSRTDYPFDIQLPPIFDYNSPSFKTSRCQQPWYGLFVNANGAVSYCCHMTHNSLIGNVFNGYDFNSAPMMKFRRTFLDGNLDPTCVKCQRRFHGQEYGRFDAKLRSWSYHNAYKETVILE